MEDHGRQIESDGFVITEVTKDVLRDPSLTCQPCGCDPGYRGNVGWSQIVGHHCIHYPNCAWGKFETNQRAQQIASCGGSAALKQIIPGYPEKFTQPAPYSDKAQSNTKQVGIGGAPTRATTLPTDAEGRKTFPIATGCLDYFPDALAAVANLSWKGNHQHNPGQPLHWARGKSADEADTMMRHFVQRGTLDSDGVRHSVKVAWRALALLQKEIEAEHG